MIEIFYDKSFSAYHLKAESTNKELYDMTALTFVGALTSMSPDDVMLNEGNLAKSVVMYCPSDTAIKETDKVTNGSDTYVIKSIKVATGRAFSFTRAILEKMES